MDKRHKLRLTLVVNMEEPVSNVRSGPNRTCQLKHSLGATVGIITQPNGIIPTRYYKPFRRTTNVGRRQVNPDDQIMVILRGTNRLCRGPR